MTTEEKVRVIEILLQAELDRPIIQDDAELQEEIECNCYATGIDLPTTMKYQPMVQKLLEEME